MDAISQHNSRTEYALYDVQQLVLSHLPTQHGKQYDTLSTWVQSKLQPYKERAYISAQEFRDLSDAISKDKPPVFGKVERTELLENHRLISNAFHAAGMDLDQLKPRKNSMQQMGRIQGFSRPLPSALETVDRDGAEIFGDAGAREGLHRAPRATNGGDWRTSYHARNQAAEQQQLQQQAAALRAVRLQAEQDALQARQTQAAQQAADEAAKEEAARMKAQAERAKAAAAQAKAAQAHVREERETQRQQAAEKRQAERAAKAAAKAQAKLERAQARDRELLERAAARAQRQAEALRARQADEAARKQTRVEKPKPAKKERVLQPKALRPARILKTTVAAIAMRKPRAELVRNPDLAPPRPNDFLLYSGVRKELGIDGNNTRYRTLWSELEALAHAQPKGDDSKVTVTLDGKSVTMGWFASHGQNSWSIARDDLPQLKAIYQARRDADRPVAAGKPVSSDAPPLPEGFLTKTELSYKMACHTQKDPEFMPMWDELVAKAEAQPRNETGRYIVKFNDTDVEMGLFRKARRTGWYISADSLPVTHAYIRDCRAERVAALERPENIGFTRLAALRPTYLAQGQDEEAFTTMRNELIRLAKLQPDHETGTVEVEYDGMQVPMRMFKSPHHTYFGVADSAVPELRDYLKEQRRDRPFVEKAFKDLSGDHARM